MFVHFSPFVLSVAATLGATNTVAEPPKAKVVAVRSSASQEGNPAIHTLDDSVTTRWSAEGAGQWIAYELDRSTELSRVDIGFHHGSRRYRFKIETSENGEAFTSVGSFTSSGKGDQAETIEFKKVRARHLRIVGNGSDANGWNNINTVHIAGVTIDKPIQIEPPKPPAPPPPKPEAGTGLVTSEFATTGMIGSAVGISVDDRGRVYVSNTTRRDNGALDIRRHMGWLRDTLASRSVEDKREMIRSRKRDWKKLFEFQETIYRLEDTDGDGKADDRKIFYRGLNTEVHGLAGGVLFHEGAAYVTCIPGFYKLPDANDDGVAEAAQELVHGFGIHIGYGGHDMHGPTLGVDGRIYWSIGDKRIGVYDTNGRDHVYPGHGGVMRIEPDGSGFEVFAHGLRNPQEIAFDEHGNLFTVDNDGDFGDQERFHYVVEGTDSGWRAHYQYRSNRRWDGFSGYNPWIVDCLWKTHHEGQPAYLTPSLANFSTGPIGFEYNPGTALSEKYRGHFFLAESNKQMQAFRVEPAGAGFKMLSPHLILKGPFVIGIRFGPDGALYLSDWGNNPWAPHDRGRVLKLDAPESERDPLRAETQRLLADGMAKRGTDELGGLLAHADQRVRLRAQFELVRRGDSGRTKLLTTAEKGTDRLARLHAIWGIGQLGRQKSDEVEPLVKLLEDDDAEVRAQAIQVIGEARFQGASASIAKLLRDASPRVRLFAGVALHHVGNSSQTGAIVEMLAESDDVDPFLRHAGVYALSGICREDHSAVLRLKEHESIAVRRAAVVTLRRLYDPEIAQFLDDSKASVVSEAARAIHDDLSIPEALDALGGLLDRGPALDESTARRAISACLRLGDQSAASRLVAYAARDENPEELRALAIETLGAWTRPPRLDAVQGFHRFQEPGDVEIAHRALDTRIGVLLSSPSKRITSATAKAIRSLKYGDATDRVTSLALDRKQDADVRVAALDAMHSLDAPKTNVAIAAGLDSKHPRLRVSALRLLAERRPHDDATLTHTTRALKSEHLEERQSAIRVLGRLESPKAVETFGSLLRDLMTAKADARVRLEIYETAKKHASQRFRVATMAFEQRLKARDENVFDLAREGGNAQRGEEIFRASSTAQCLRCHAVQGDTRNVGPSLAGIATKRDRAHLHRAVVAPEADVEEAYRVRLFILKNGTTVAGSILEEKPDSLRVAKGVGELVTVRRSDIANEVPQAGSVMPDLAKTLRLSEIRDLVEYLSTLR